MKLGLIKNLLLVGIIAVFAVACMDSGDDYIPPTKEEEMALLAEYLDTLEARGYEINSTDLGVYYVIDSIGEGEYPLDGDTCSVRYTGFFLNGQVFDSSGEYTFDVELGKGQVIEGWEDGLKVFNTNAEGLLIIPSEFAYGSTGFSSIPPNTTLGFVIEMVEIKKGS